MTHGLTKFEAQEIIKKSQSAIELMERALESDAGEGNQEVTQEAVRIVLENQIRIAETLDLIKKEFDKFEEGLGKIL